MKKIIFLLVILACGIVAAGPKARPMIVVTGTVQYAPLLIRTITANDTMLDADTKTWTNCDANGVEIPLEWSWLCLSVYAYDTNGGCDGNTATIYIYGCEYQGGIRTIGYGNLTIGTVQLSHNPISGDALNATATADPNRCWMDTYTALDSGIWTQAIKLSGAGGSDPNGNIAGIWFDRLNLYKIWVDVNNATFGGAGGIDSLTIIMNGGS